jgi:hypothetical protein
MAKQYFFEEYINPKNRFHILKISNKQGLTQGKYMTDDQRLLPDDVIVLKQSIE